MCHTEGRTHVTDITGQAEETQAELFMNDPVADVIARLAEEGEQKKLAASNARIAELQAEMAAETEAVTQIVGIPRKAHDIWTLRTMKKHKPTPADLNEDGKFIFHFMPVMGNAYCQERLVDRWNDFQAKKITYSKVVTGYCEVVFEALRSKGCNWPLRETEQDDEGNDLYDIVEVDGTPTEVLRSTPLPITLDNIKRLDEETVVQFINAMSRAMRGEANGQR